MIRLAIPNISGNEGRYLQECVTTNFVSSVGPFVTKFEELCAAATGAKSAVAVSSGTSGLHLALMTVGVGRDDLVVLPSFTFIASANAVSHCGATPWLFDVSPDSWTLDAKQVGEALRRGTRKQAGRRIHIESGRRVAAIMPVYTLGQPADMDALRTLATEYEIPLVADAAAALGARYKNRNIAELADLSVASFNGNKTVTAGGGGVLVGMDTKLLDRARHVSTTARTGQDYDHDEVGFNYRMTNIQAAVGAAQMERLDEFVSIKRRIAGRYDRELRGELGLEPFPHVPWAQSACWFAGALLPPTHAGRIGEIAAGLRDLGIEARSFWKPVHHQRPYASCPRDAMTTSDAIWSRVLTFPCSTGLTESEQTQVIESVRKVLRGRA